MRAERFTDSRLVFQLNQDRHAGRVLNRSLLQIGFYVSWRLDQSRRLAAVRREPTGVYSCSCPPFPHRHGQTRSTRSDQLITMRLMVTSAFRSRYARADRLLPAISRTSPNGRKLAPSVGGDLTPQSPTPAPVSKSAAGFSHCRQRHSTRRAARPSGRGRAGTWR